MFGLAAETLSAAEAAQFIVGVFSPLAETDRLTVMRLVSQPSPPEK